MSHSSRNNALDPNRSPSRRFWSALLPPLIAAVLCTALIAEAIHTALTGIDNGDLMVLVCPILGAIFLSIPATQTWIAAIRILVRGPTSGAQ